MGHSRQYRDRAEAERQAAAVALPCVREIHLKSAFVWDRMAEEADAAAEARHRNNLFKLVATQSSMSAPTRRVSRITRKR